MPRRRRVIPALALMLVLMPVMTSVDPAAHQTTPGGTPSANLSWTSLPGVPQPRSELGAAVIGERIYVVGGSGGGSHVEVFDTTTSTWTRLADLPTAVNHVAAAALDGRLYAAGGYVEPGGFAEPGLLPGDAVSSLWSYDPTTNIWERRAEMPTARGALGLAALDGRLYAIGGAQGGVVTGAVEEYDPTTNTWQPRAPMSTPRDHLAVTAGVGRVFAVGGRAILDESDSLAGAAETYDPAADRWEPLPPLPTPRGGFSAVFAADRVVVLGGERGTTTYDTVEAFDPDTWSWAALPPLPTPRHGVASAAVGTTVYAIAGSTEAKAAVNTPAFEAITLQPTMLPGTPENAVNPGPATPHALGPAIPPELATFAADWPVSQGNLAAHRAALASPITAATVGRLTVAWTFPVAAFGPFGGMTASPVVAGDTVYVQDMQGNVFALDRATGGVKWEQRYAIPTEGPNGVAIGYGMVFATLGDTAEVVALAAATGAELWRVDLSNNPGEGIDMVPTVYDNVVYVSTVPGTSTEFYEGGQRGVLSALDAKTGSPLWSFDTTTDNLWGNPVVNSGGGLWHPLSVDAAGNLYFGTANPGPWPGIETHLGAFPNGSSRPGPNDYANSLVSLDSRTGAIRWHHNAKPHDLFDHDFQATPVLVTVPTNGRETTIAIGAGKTGTVIAFDAATGALLWKTAVGKHQNDELREIPPGETVEVYPGTLGGVETPMAYAAGTLFVPVVNRWSRFTATTQEVGQPLAEATGELVALNAADGSLKWRVDLPQMPLGGTAVANDVVFISTIDGVLRAYQAATGAELWTYRAPAGFAAPMAIAGDMVIVPAAAPLIGGPNDGQTTPTVIAFRLAAPAAATPAPGHRRPNGRATAPALHLAYAQSRGGRRATRAPQRGVSMDPRHPAPLRRILSRRVSRRAALGSLAAAAGIATHRAVEAGRSQPSLATQAEPAPASTPEDGAAVVDWSLVAPVPVQRAETQGGVAAGKLHVFGGYDRWNPSVPTRRSDAYDPASDTWTPLPDLPEPLTHAGCAVDGNQIYLAGGHVGTSDGEVYGTTAVWRFDVAAQTWTAMPPLPAPRGSGGLVLLGRELHFFGGEEPSRVEQGDHWMLSLDGEASWTSGAPLPNPRTHFGAAALDRIYAIGGQHGHEGAAIAPPSGHAWDPATDTWSEVASLLNPWSHIAGSTFAIDDQIVVLGGEIAPGQLLPDVRAYHPPSNAWTSMTLLPTAPMSGVAGAIGGTIYLSAGALLPSNTIEPTTYKGVLGRPTDSA